MLSEWDLISKKKCFLPSAVKIARDISEAFPIKNLPRFLEYARIFDDGTCIVLCTEPGAIKIVFEEASHITAHIPSDFVKDRFWYLIPSQGSYSHLMRALKEGFNFGHVMDFIDRYDGFYDMYCFTSSASSETAASIYLNQAHLIESFVENFKNKIHPLINELSKDKIQLNSQMLPNIGGLKGRINLDRYLGQMQIQARQLALNSKKFGLSKREEECVSYLTLGLTSKEIAGELDLSFRTVESYIQNIRSKLRCSRKSEIVKTLINQ